MATNKFERAEVRIELLKRLNDTLISEQDYIIHPYMIVGRSETEQEKDHKGNPVWDDEAQTIPTMKAIWGYGDKTEDELSDQQKLKLEVIEEIRTCLEKLI